MNKSFKKRVQQFWEAFTKEEGQIRDMMDNKAEGETLLNFVNSILQIAFTEVYFEMGINKEDKYELILTPEGDHIRLLQLYYWQQQAPAKLSEKWNFYSSKPNSSNSNWRMEMYGVSIDRDDITLYAEIDNERRKFNLEIYCPKLMSLDENKRFSMFFIFLDQMISELYTMEYIGYIDFVETELDKEHIKINELKAYIDDTIEKNEWSTYTNPYEIFHAYQMTPSEAENWTLREDIAMGYTSCTGVLNAFYKNDEEVINKYKDDGVVFGFLFVNNTHIPRENVVNFRTEIEDLIIEKTAQSGIAYCLGGATGFHFSYIDLIIFDFDAFIDIIKEVIPFNKYEEFGYSDFVSNSTPIMLS